MARRESQAVAGYYKTPVSQLPHIAARLDLAPAELDYQRKPTEQRIAIVDPCAGDGEAACLLAKMIEAGETHIYACEVEGTRHAELEKRVTGVRQHWSDHQRALHADAFCVVYDAEPGAGFLYLNPPYDQDPDARGARMEEKFLVRFAPALARGGVLAFVVPYYVLAQSADTIARLFENVGCYRFTADEFQAYKQVVLFATRREDDLDEPDPDTAFAVTSWSTDASRVPEISLNDGRTWTIPILRGLREGFSKWEKRTADVAGLAAVHRPWHESVRGQGLSPVSQVVPRSLADLEHRSYEVAVPPRPAYIAAGLAAGLFNGQRVEPDDPAGGLPPLLVKGVFDREWRAIDEKKNKDGEVTAVVEVQAPRLVVTVLDIRAHKYATLRADVEKTGAREVERMTVGDILDHYGRSLAAVMAAQCRVLYDARGSAGREEIAGTPRRPFDAQAHAVRACVAVLRKRCQAATFRAAPRQPGWAVLLLGEVGVGKASVALLTAKTVGCHRPLVVCPPHLLANWANEVAAVTPEAEVRILSSVADVDALALEPDDVKIVAVLSREAAKLGHAWEGVRTSRPAGEVLPLPGGASPLHTVRDVTIAGACPRCGSALPEKVDFAKKRSRCEAHARRPKNECARLAVELALYLRQYAPDDAAVRSILGGRLDDQLLETRRERAEKGEEYRAPAYAGMPASLALRIRSALAWEWVRKPWDGMQHRDAEEVRTAVARGIARLCAAAPDTAALARTSALLVACGDGYSHAGESLALLAPESERGLVREALRPFKGRYFQDSTPLKRAEGYWKSLAESAADASKAAPQVAGLPVAWKDGRLYLNGIEAGTVAAALALLKSVAGRARWETSPACGEPLYGAAPELHRYPLAKYIQRRHSNLFDFLIVDEGQDYGSGESAQTHAVHRLSSLGLPTMLLTGSIMNGYASSLFPNMWAFSAEFRESYGRREEGAFVDRYGYRKRVVAVDGDDEVLSYGSHSDRVERSGKDAGEAPGILPVFLFRHLLPIAVTLQKEDLRINLPRLDITPREVQPSSELLAEYNRLLDAVSRRIKADRFQKGLAGKLFGALAELPSYLDRATADVGNGGDGVFEVRYPESCGGKLVASARLFPASTILPKEEETLAIVERELAEGRNVMVFAWHTELLPRLARIIEKRTGEKVAVLLADKVPTAKRQAWIDREVVGKKRRVMVCNPVCVQTGLNNLVYFATEVWHQDPACNPLVYRQAIGRIDRIGQTRETRSLILYYGGTLQSARYDLLMDKVAISTATDGLDPESALRAAGASEGSILAGLSLGRELWKRMGGDDAVQGGEVVEMAEARAAAAEPAKGKARTRAVRRGSRS